MPRYGECERQNPYRGAIYMQYHKPRMRKVRILATLGPASDTPEMIEKLFRAGADAFQYPRARKSL
jgi:hypothetical protein